MRAIVCGGRDFADDRLLYSVLDRIHAETPITLVVSGGCSGADQLAIAWSHERGIERLVVLADWRTFGKGAGPRRNAQMLRDGRPDVVIAFPGGKGTEDMVRRAEAERVRVVRVDAQEERR